MTLVRHRLRRFYGGNCNISYIIAVPSDATAFHLDPAKVKEHFTRVGGFRVLVMGRSNAGKTTILQRVCNTTELPEVFNAAGEKVPRTTILLVNYSWVAMVRSIP